METGGYKDSEVVPLPSSKCLPGSFPCGVGPSARAGQASRGGAAWQVRSEALRKFEFSDGGDKAYVKLDRSKSVEPAQIDEILRSVNIKSNQVQRFGRPEDNTFEVVLVGLDREVRAALDSKLGQGAVSAIPSVGSVGAKAGRSCATTASSRCWPRSAFIMLYILVRFDFRYGPGTVIALLHDAIFVLGAFALTYKEFSLTTIAAILTVIGYSMNDTIVVFDRIRENASKMRDKKFPMIVNLSVNETLSRTILTSATVFFVTLAMNIWGTGVIRDFAFAMNVGVIVGTYSSIFIASPILIWLNEKSMQSQKTPPFERCFARLTAPEPQSGAPCPPFRCPAFPNFSTAASSSIFAATASLSATPAMVRPCFVCTAFRRRATTLRGLCQSLSRTGGWCCSTFGFGFPTSRKTIPTRCSSKPTLPKRWPRSFLSEADALAHDMGSSVALELCDGARRDRAPGAAQRAACFCATIGLFVAAFAPAQTGGAASDETGAYQPAGVPRAVCLLFPDRPSDEGWTCFGN